MWYHKEWSPLISSYLKDSINYDISPEDVPIEYNNDVEFRGLYYDALAYYRMKDYTFNLEEIKDPEEGQFALLRNGEHATWYYRFLNGAWKYQFDCPDHI